MQRASKMMKVLIEDASSKCSTDVQVRDISTIKRRLAHEGLSFLTITLPNFLQDFMDCLEQGEVTSSSFLGWRKRQCLPAFLQGFTRLVFCTKSGRLLNEPSSEAIHSIRQICSFFKKIKLPCTAARERAALRDYARIDRELGGVMDNIPDHKLTRFVSISRILWGTVFGYEWDESDLFPHHGPGSTAEAITGNKKYIPGKFPWFTGLNDHFRIGELLFNSEESWFCSDISVPEESEPSKMPVRVVTVPKTQKGPRVIAMEPVAMQMAQQAVKEKVVGRLEHHWLTAGHVNFRDQTVNQQLALESSATGRLATLDLSAASDRIPRDLIWIMLDVNPKLRSLVFSTRSRYANVDGEELIFLNKFASMGSALCFPIEAMYFITLIVLARLDAKGLPVSIKSIADMMEDAYVYGDDIIIPVGEVEAVVDTLLSFGSVVSREKSFWKGGFRESCGMDAFKGRDVTPVYLRNLIPYSQKHSNAIVSSVATANLLHERGFFRAANELAKFIEGVVGTLPQVADTCEGIGWRFTREKENLARYCRRLQRFEVRTLVPQPILKKDRISGWPALTKCLMKLERRSRDVVKHTHPKTREDREIFDRFAFDDKRHLSLSPRFGALTLKRRWTTPY